MVDNIGCPGQAKRHPGYVKQKYYIHALKGQKRKNIKALGMRNKSTISTLLPFQGVNGFTNDNPTQGAASLALTLKVQRAKHAINDNSHSYAVEEPLKPIRA